VRESGERWVRAERVGVERAREPSLSFFFPSPKNKTQADAAAAPTTTTTTAEPEIHPDDPHHGPAPLGAAAAHRAFARLEGPAAEALMARYTPPEEVLELPGHCAACGGGTTTRVYRTTIPFFKEVILMADACDACGYRNAEVKGGGGVPPLGRRLELAVRTPADLRRDVIKAETARVAIPELDLEVSTGSLGGLITTVEGLALAVRDSLKSTQTFQLGDAADRLDPASLTWKTFYEGLEACAAGDRPWTLVMSDPMANSFISGPPGVGPGDEADLAADPGLKMEDYERSPEEDAEYGIDHLRAHEAGNAAGGGVGDGGAIEEGDEGEEEGGEGEG
jgi:zinc finger protein